MTKLFLILSLMMVGSYSNQVVAAEGDTVKKEQKKKKTKKKKSKKSKKKAKKQAAKKSDTSESSDSDERKVAELEAATDSGSRGRLVRSNKGNQKVKGLKWATRRPTIKFVGSGKGAKVVAELRGRFNRKDWNLMWDEKWILRSFIGQKEFMFQAPLTGKVTPIEILAIGPSGEIKTEKFVVKVKNYKRLKELSQKSGSKRLQFYASGGFTYNNYQESGLDPVNGKPYTALMLTLKGSVRYIMFPPNWDVGLSSYFTVLPLADSRSDTEARFLGVNFRVGYVLPWLNDPWRLTIMGGWYYTTMFVADSVFGFRNMTGPQIFPVLSYQFKPKHSGSIYVKFSPIMDGFGFSNLADNKEFASGVAWNYILGNGHPFSVALDFATFTLAISRVNISSTSLSLSAGYGF